MKTILISGATGNLGAAVAHFYLEKGWQVIALVREKSAEKKENYFEFEADLMDENGSREVVEKITSELGRIDIAVLTAGGYADGDVFGTTMQEINFQIALNFSTAYNVAHPLLKIMKEQSGGQLFFVGSQPGMDTKKGGHAVAYSLSKSLLFQLANIINSSVAQEHVFARVVVPGIIDTPQNHANMPDVDSTRWQKPEDIARIIWNHAKQNNFTKNEIVISEELKKL